MDQPKMAEATNKETRADKKGPNKGTAPSKAETPKAAKKAGAGPINTGYKDTLGGAQQRYSHSRGKGERRTKDKHPIQQTQQEGALQRDNHHQAGGAKPKKTGRSGGQ